MGPHEVCQVTGGGMVDTAKTCSGAGDGEADGDQVHQHQEPGSVGPSVSLCQIWHIGNGLPRVRGSGPMWKIYHIGGSFRQIWRNVVQVKAGRDAQDVVISQETALYKAFCGVYGSGRGGGRVNLEALETAL